MLFYYDRKDVYNFVSTGYFHKYLRWWKIDSIWAENKQYREKINAVSFQIVAKFVYIGKSIQ